MLRQPSVASRSIVQKMSQTATFPGQFESLAKISQFVVQAARAAGLNEDAVYAVDLAVDEACTNIIEHAYGGEGNGDIVCTCTTTPEGLKILLHDRGKKFTPSKVPLPNTKARLKDVKSRGAGLFLIYKMMDKVHFDFNEDAGNTLTMEKYRASQTPKTT
jgi:serine/threonine-protein kinase RsbW